MLSRAPGVVSVSSMTPSPPRMAARAASNTIEPSVKRIQRMTRSSSTRVRVCSMVGDEVVIGVMVVSGEVVEEDGVGPVRDVRIYAIDPETQSPTSHEVRGGRLVGHVLAGRKDLMASLANWASIVRCCRVRWPCNCGGSPDATEPNVGPGTAGRKTELRVSTFPYDRR